MASARSLATIRERLYDLPLSLPVINFNGAFLSDLHSGKHFFVNAFRDEVVSDLLEFLEPLGFHPVFSTYDGERDNLYLPEPNNPGLDWYVGERHKARDPRLRPPKALESILSEQVVCITLIDRHPILEPIRLEVLERFAGRTQIYYYENVYSPGWHWITLHDPRATKSHALEELLLLEKLDAGRLVVFGDELNDLPMFELAGHSVAVGNAHPEVCRAADEVIGFHHEDAVARYLAATLGATLDGPPRIDNPF